MKKIYLTALAYTVLNTVMYAQEQLITYHGQFRTLMSDNRLSGNVLNQDSLSPRRGALGTMFLDMGITVKPNEDVKILAEFRFRNIIGQDINQNGVLLITGNNLIDSRMIFRQVRAEGLIRKVISYQIGDIDVGLTKYTLHREPEIYSDFESDIYKTRRAIANYENFQTGNMWRIQGLTAKSQINLRGIVRKIDIKGFAARTRKNSNDGVPDRFLLGGNITVLQSKYFSLGGSYTSLFDVPGSTVDSLEQYKYVNQVYTANYAITPLIKEKIELGLVGEFGSSKNRFDLYTLDTSNSKSDFFMDLGLKGVYKPKKIELTASYINVGYNFTSPGAQSLSLSPFNVPTILPNIQNNNFSRMPTSYDRLSDEYIYNQRIQTGLMQFNPIYGNVLPYGMATPNRTGIVFNLVRAIDTANVISFNLGGAVLSELIPEGDTIGKRDFQQLKGGVSFRLSKLVGFSKNITLTVGGRQEKTSRDGSASIDFSTMLLDAGLTVEVLRGVSLIGGMKQLNAKGIEVRTSRDIFGSIDGYTPFNLDAQTIITSGGVRVELFKNSFASVEYNKFSLKEKTNVNENYSIGNMFINFTLRF